MSQIADVASALLAQLAKLVKSISDDQIKLVAAGESKLVLLPPGHRVVEASAALNMALKVTNQMTAEELQQVEDRQARIVLLPKGAKINHPLDPVEVAAQVAKLTSEAEIVRFLDADSRLTPPKLKKVAAEMNVVVPPSVRTKAALQLHIAQNAVRDRGRWSWR